jgi:tRNA splicing ligase
MTEILQLSEYNKLSSKYEFNKVACIQNNEFQDIDTLIKNINELGNNSNVRNNINKKYKRY